MSRLSSQRVKSGEKSAFVSELEDIFVQGCDITAFNRQNRQLIQTAMQVSGLPLFERLSAESQELPKMKTENVLKTAQFAAFLDQIDSHVAEWPSEKVVREFKVQMFQSCLHIREKYTLSFNYSYSFLQTFSSLKEKNPLGLDNELLDKFKAAVDRQRELTLKSKQR